MRPPVRLPAVAALALGSTLALVPGTAHSASSQIGSSCVATNVTLPGGTVVLTALASGAAAAPAAGIITKATFNVPAEAPAVSPQTLKAMRPTGTPHEFTVTAQTAVLQVPNHVATFDLRLPIGAGDLIGLHGSNPGAGAGALYCTPTSAGDT